MALQKDFITPFGVTGNYWKITDVTLSMNFAIFHISCYVDHAARLANAEPLVLKEISIDGGIPVVDMQPANSDVYAVCYNAIKKNAVRQDNQSTITNDKEETTPFFADSIDV